jgi:hypothetical protein
MTSDPFEKKLYPVAPADWMHVPGFRKLRMKQVAARQTGEFRPPRIGEWFLSGAIIEAYVAHGPMTTSYFIAELVEVEEAVVVSVVRVLTPQGRS